MKKKIFIILTVLSIVFGLCACGEKQVKYDIESDVNFVRDIFACVDIETLAEEYSDDITSYDDLEIEETFAEIDGIYEIELYEKGDNPIHESGEIYSVCFKWEWSYKEEVPMQDIVAAITEYLGEPNSYNEEWGHYTWFGSDTKETKFSNTLFGNCFDIEIFGDDCYINFGLSTQA